MLCRILFSLAAAISSFCCLTEVVQAQTERKIFDNPRDLAIYTYQQVLGRSPNPANEEPFVLNDINFLTKGTTINQIKRNFEIKATSQEFQNKLAGLSDEKKIDKIYDALLKRGGDPVGYAGYIPLLKAKGEPEVVHHIIWEACDEFDSRVPFLKNMKVVFSDPPRFKINPGYEKRQLNPKAWTYKLDAGTEARVQELITIIGATQEDIAIVCAGPNRVYFHTEGNPPAFGRNDNGYVQPGQVSRFTISSAAIFVPRVFIKATDGPSTVGIYYGDVSMFNIGTNVPKAIEEINKKFPRQ